MKDFFGLLNRVIELRYLGGRRVVLFQCDWFHCGSPKTLQSHKHFTSIDVSSRWYEQDPFVLPIQVQQVFYIKDTKLGKCNIGICGMFQSVISMKIVLQIHFKNFNQ